MISSNRNGTPSRRRAAQPSLSPRATSTAYNPHDAQLIEETDASSGETTTSLPTTATTAAAATRWTSTATRATRTRSTLTPWPRRSRGSLRAVDPEQQRRRGDRAGEGHLSPDGGSVPTAASTTSATPTSTASRATRSLRRLRGDGGGDVRSQAKIKRPLEDYESGCTAPCPSADLRRVLVVPVPLAPETTTAARSAMGGASSRGTPVREAPAGAGIARARARARPNTNRIRVRTGVPRRDMQRRSGAPPSPVAPSPPAKPRRFGGAATAGPGRGYRRGGRGGFAARWVRRACRARRHGSGGRGDGSLR